jgi:serine/threonine protein kinase
MSFLREARAAASVRHPNVASVFHLGRTGRNYFYAMEFVEGGNVRKSHQALRQAGGKAGAANRDAGGCRFGCGPRVRLVHRDIKPSNFMVRVEEGRTVTGKIIDLGLAKPVADAPAEAAISMPGAFAGTPEFASPEQFPKEKPPADSFREIAVSADDSHGFRRGAAVCEISPAGPSGPRRRASQTSRSLHPTKSACTHRHIR